MKLHTFPKNQKERDENSKEITKMIQQLNIPKEERNKISQILLEDALKNYAHMQMVNKRNYRRTKLYLEQAEREFINNLRKQKKLKTIDDLRKEIAKADLFFCAKVNKLNYHKKAKNHPLLNHNEVVIVLEPMEIYLIEIVER